MTSESASVRRLPIYLVLDCSGSMTGEPIAAVNMGIRALLSDLRGDPQALETAYLSIVTFATDAKQLSPLTEISLFQAPELVPGGSTSLGHALAVLEDAVAREVRKSSATVKGDWKPLVWVATDGQPTDSWEGPAARLKNAGIANIIGVACGPSADTDMLKKLTETVVLMKDVQPDTFKNFFRWVSASIRTMSTSIAKPGAGAPVNMPAPPTGITLVP